MSSIGTQRETRMAEIAGQLNVLNAELVTIVAGAIADHSWSGYGIHSPAQWLTIELGVSPAHAKHLVETATHAAAFPTIMGEFTAGRLSLDQTHVVLTKAPAWADPKLVNTATSATVPQLRRMIRKEYFEGPDTPDETATGPADRNRADDADEQSMRQNQRPAHRLLLRLRRIGCRSVGTDHGSPAPSTSPPTPARSSKPHSTKPATRCSMTVSPTSPGPTPSPKSPCDHSTMLRSLAAPSSKPCSTSPSMTSAVRRTVQQRGAVTHRDPRLPHV